MRLTAKLVRRFFLTLLPPKFLLPFFKLRILAFFYSASIERQPLLDFGVSFIMLPTPHVWTGKHWSILVNTCNGVPSILGNNTKIHGAKSIFNWAKLCYLENNPTFQRNWVECQMRAPTSISGFARLNLSAHLQMAPLVPTNSRGEGG